MRELMKILFKDLLGQHISLLLINRYNINFLLVRDLDNTIDFCFYTDKLLHLAKHDDFKTKIGIILEPLVINKQSYIDMIKYKNDFDKIYTHHLKYVDNEKIFWYPFGGTFILDNHSKLYTKTKNISILISNKKYTKGQSLRHLVAQKYKNIDIYGLSYIPIGISPSLKIKTLQSYRYQICILNDKQDGFFTLKLIDCFRTGVIPIYWGGNLNIILDLNIKGIILFNNILLLDYIINNFDLNYYVLNLLAIKNNFLISHRYLSPFNWIYNRGLN